MDIFCFVDSVFGDEMSVVKVLKFSLYLEKWLEGNRKMVESGLGGCFFFVGNSVGFVFWLSFV